VIPIDGSRARLATNFVSRTGPNWFIEWQNNLDGVGQRSQLASDLVLSGMERSPRNLY